MRKLQNALFTGIACLSLTLSHAQPCFFLEDYGSDAGWMDFYYYYAVTGACLSDEQDGTLGFGAGKLNFNALDDANDTRMYYTMPAAVYEDFWTVSGEFTPTAGGASGRTGSIIFSLSNGDTNPVSDTYSICTYSNTDAISLMWTSDFDAAPENIGFEIWANDNGTVTTSERLIAPYGDTYYFQMTRIAVDYMSLDVFLDAAHTEIFATIPCFDVPSTITGLNTVQHGNFPGGSYLRQLTATLDNVCVRNIDVVAASITGPETICIGSTNAYTITTFAGADIDWTVPDGIDYTGGAGATITVNDWPGADTYTLMCVISYNCFYDTAYLDVTVLDPGSGTFSEESFCEGGSYTYDAFQTDASYLWDNGDTLSSQTFTETGVHWVTVSVAGCTYTDTISVTVHPNPTIELGEDQDICGETVIEGVEGFTAYAWSDGSSTQYLVTETPGSYSVVVTDANGCTATDTITLNNGCADHIAFPNVFSPNQDGVNDVFMPNYSGEVKDYHLEIWSRWGQLVFDTNDISKGWNGRYEDTDQPIGSYVFIWRAKLNGEKLEEQSNLILVR